MMPTVQGESIPSFNTDPTGGPSAEPVGPVELAVLNNTRWYQAMFDAHGLASTVDGRVWLSHQTPPPFHSNLVVLSPNTSQNDVAAYVSDLERVPSRTAMHALTSRRSALHGCSKPNGCGAIHCRQRAAVGTPNSCGPR
jgi:hypothetical protein